MYREDPIPICPVSHLSQGEIIEKILLEAAWKPMVERISALGLDVGDRRIGVAGCDGTGLIATGLGVIHRSRRKGADSAAVQEWVNRRQAQILVIGLPLHSDGTEGPQARKVRRFVRAIQGQIGLPIDYVNEYLSTVQATWDLRDSGVKTDHKQLIDQQAAAVILQEWLDHRRQSLDQSATR